MSSIGQQKKVVKQELKAFFKKMPEDEQLQCIEDMKIARDTGITGPAVDLQNWDKIMHVAKVIQNHTKKYLYHNMCKYIPYGIF